VRLAVYTDYAYHRQGDQVYAERAFARFLDALAGQMDRLVVAGRLSPEPGKARYALRDVEYLPLPYYETLARPGRALFGMARSLGQLWRALDHVDAIWIFGPHLLALPIAAMAVVRRRRVFLGVRQEYGEYVRHRHPGRRGLHLLGQIVEGGFRALARSCSVIVVGPRLADDYRHARRLLQISVSLINDEDIVPPERALARSWDQELRAISVGRLDPEKDPLLLADVLARADERWRLLVCGEGSLEGELRQRLTDLDLLPRAELRGYVPFEELRQLYEVSHALLHVSRTEGVPQVLFEAFAAGTPVVATDVGGIHGTADGAALLSPPGDAAAAASHLNRLAGDRELRRSLVEAGTAIARAHTLGREVQTVVAFMAG
jgi:glycosyltransferase involved in cell wall biosynthesis